MRGTKPAPLLVVPLSGDSLCMFSDSVSIRKYPWVVALRTLKCHWAPTDRALWNPSKKGR